MRSSIIVIFLIFLATAAYVAWHLWRLTPGTWVVKSIVAGLFLIWMALAFASIGLRKNASIGAITALYEVGHPWMIAYLYLLIAFILADIGRLVGLGIHYKHKFREELTIKTDKPLEKPLTVVLASDLHLGYSNRRPELARWIDLINAEDPDLVLFGGDIVDIQLRPLLDGDYASEFARIKAPMYTVLGNHEYISQEEEAEKFLSAAGITLLRDSVARVGDITIIGRDDRSNPGRKALSELADSLNGFTVLLDHQPFHLEEAEDAGIDFQFSGHTHRGQVWPLSWVTDAMYEKSWGHHTRGNTRYYVSSGLGIWGPKIRIGTRSEYLVLHIE